MRAGKFSPRILSGFIVLSALVAATMAAPAQAAPAQAAPAQAAAATPGGSLTLVNNHPVSGDALQFAFTTTKPNALNWIGLYNTTTGGPTDQKYHAASTVFRYTPASAAGTVTIPSAALKTGVTITAFLLYNDGYTWLAQPITFTVSMPPPYNGQPTGPHFAVDDFTTAAVGVATPVRVDVAGLWFPTGGSPATFTKQAGASWLSVDSLGQITGTTPALAPTSTTRPARIVVAARDTAGKTGTITVEFPLHTVDVPPTLTVATLSLWPAGNVANPLEKLIKSILINRLDAVGLQNTGSTMATQVAALLGWHVIETTGGLGLISRYALAPEAVVIPAGLPALAASATVEGHSVSVWVAALDTGDPGVDRACLAHDPDPAASELTTKRYAQAVDLTSALSSDLAASRATPVILLAALASPSALDWTVATSASHCSAGAVDWPVPAMLQSVGFMDSFRSSHPDPAAIPGNTFPIVGDAPTGDAAVRLDYVDLAGNIDIVESHALVDGFPAAVPAASANSWVSDHAAVVTKVVLRTTAAEPNPLPTSTQPTVPAGSAGSGKATEPTQVVTADASNASPVASAVTGPVAGSPAAQTLAFTGVAIGGSLAAGALLIFLGIAFLVRRRSPNKEHVS